MKRLMTLIVLLLLGLGSAIAQEGAPKGFSYQALIYDGAKPLAGAEVKLEVTLQDESNVLYTERHSALKTSALGITDILVGTGTVVSGSLDAVDWEAGVFIALKIEKGGAYQPLGQPVKVPTVPYALYASQQASSTTQGSGVNPNEPIFQVLNSEGKRIFGVYEHGIRVSVAEEPTRGVRGGFAVATYSKGGQQELKALSLSEGRFDLMVMDGVERGVRGGFAVATRSAGESSFVERFSISGGAVDILVDEPLRGVRGGFAVARRGFTLPTMEVGSSVQMNVDRALRGVRGGFAVANYRLAADRSGGDDELDELMLLNNQMSYFTLDRSGSSSGSSSFTLRDRRDLEKVLVSFVSGGSIYAGKGEPGKTILKKPDDMSKIQADWEFGRMSYGQRWNYPTVSYDGKPVQYKLELNYGMDQYFEIRRLYNPNQGTYVEGIVLKEGVNITGGKLEVDFSCAVYLVDNPELHKYSAKSFIVDEQLVEEVVGKTYYVSHDPVNPVPTKVYVELEYKPFGKTRTHPVANLPVSVEIMDASLKAKINVIQDPRGLLFTMSGKDFTELTAAGKLNNVSIRLVSEYLQGGSKTIEVKLTM